MGRVCSDDDYDTSSSSYDDVVRIRLGELAVVQRSDGTWRYAILDGREPSRLLARGEMPLLSPTLAWQRGEGPWRCNVANVVFCEAAAPLGGDRFRIWFGGADAHVGTAVVRVSVSS